MFAGFPNHELSTHCSSVNKFNEILKISVNCRNGFTINKQKTIEIHLWYKFIPENTLELCFNDTNLTVKGQPPSILL